MNKKRELVILSCIIVFVLLLNFSIAATNTTNTSSTALAGTFEKSYECLKNKVNEKISSDMTTEQLAFSLLALGYDRTMQDKIKKELDDLKSSSYSCWPKSGCTIRDTALVLLAFDNIGQNTDKIKDWLLNQTISTSDLIWYLQIDSNNKTSCTISVNGSSSQKVSVEEDKKVTGSFGSCFRSGYNGYWLEIQPICYGKEIEISCENSFVTSLIYKKKAGAGSNIYYISSNTNTGNSGDKTIEKVNAKCFKQSSSCNYEGSLWASLALQKKSENIDSFIPYLITMAEDNKRYFPSAFLFAIKGYNEYLGDIVNQQNKLGYWRLSEESRKYYDTALGVLSLYRESGSSDKVELAKDWLLSPSISGKEGCWNNNIADIAFLLYASSPKTALKDGVTTQKCSDFSSQGYECMFASSCDNLNGSKLDYSCNSFQVCCNKPSASKKTCLELGGQICSSNYDCLPAEGITTEAKEIGCCKNPGICTAKPTPAESQCIVQGYDCKSSCDSDTEESKSYECENNMECCTAKTTPEPTSYWWIWLLVILIILIILAIIFRNQLKIWLFRVKSGFSKSPVDSRQRPPGFPPRTPPNSFIPRPMMPPRPGMPMPQRYPPQQRYPQMQRPPQQFPRDKELDDTLKKLRDMGK